MGVFTSCARVLLIAFNFVFWLSGAAILGVGIWILVDPDIKEYLDVVEEGSGEDDFLQTAAYILIAFGTFIFLVGFCGCCGAIRSSKCLIGFYIFFLVIVFAGELAAGILVAVYKGEVEDKFDKEMTNAIRQKYEKESSWDFVQKELKCCGGISPDDYINSTWANNNPDNNVLPSSCCKLNADGDPINLSNCQSHISDFYEKGCKEELLDWVDDHSIILIGVGCGIAALQIFGLIFAVCLCRHIDQDKY